MAILFDEKGRPLSAYAINPPGDTQQDRAESVAQAAVGKTIRWGLGSVNPELRVSEREANGYWVLREIRDLEGAIKRARRFLKKEGYSDK